VVGQTASSDFVGLGTPVSGPSDAFVIKVSADGSQIVQGKTFGGSGDDYASGVAPDGQGGWLLCGVTTSTDFPTSSGAIQTQLLGQRNGWVRRTSATFDTVYSTYFGGSMIDGCLNITGDASGNAYLVGVSFSYDLPITPGAFQEDASAISDGTTYDKGLGPQFYVLDSNQVGLDREAYFAEIASDGRSVLYGTYLGGVVTVPPGYAALTIGTGITGSPSGTFYVSGATDAMSFPVTDGGLRNGMGGEADGFIVSFKDSPLSITTPAFLPQAGLQMPYNVSLAATGGTPPYTWSYVGPTTSSMPTGISLSPQGVISGSAVNPPANNAQNQITVKVTDATGAVAYKSLFLNLYYPGTPICSGDTCLLSVLAFQTVAEAQADGGSGPIPSLARGVPPQTFSVTGQLPTGLTVSADGTMSGGPITAGEYRFGTVVTDKAGHSGTINWDMLVGTDPHPNVSLQASSSSPTIGQTLTLSWTSFETTGCIASGGGADGTSWTGTLPIFGSTTQTVSRAGSFGYTVTCPTGTGSPLQASVTVTVAGSSSSGGGGGAAGGGGGGGVSWLDLEVLALLIAGTRVWRGAGRGPRRVRCPGR
jgi:hypothetical protein